MPATCLYEAALVCLMSPAQVAVQANKVTIIGEAGDLSQSTTAAPAPGNHLLGCRSLVVWQGDESMARG